MEAQKHDPREPDWHAQIVSMAGGRSHPAGRSVAIIQAYRSLMGAMTEEERESALIQLRDLGEIELV